MPDTRNQSARNCHPKKLPAKELTLSKHDKQRVLDVAAGMVQYFEAESDGDKEAMTRYKNDIMYIAKAQPLRSAVFENYEVRNEVLQLKRRLHRLATAALDVVTKVENADDQTLPADLVAAASVLRQELVDVDIIRLVNLAPANEPKENKTDVELAPSLHARLHTKGDRSQTEPIACSDRRSDVALASQSLLQKYGPRHINDFLGLRAPRQLITALSRTPVKSEYLFVGPPGVGKSSLAIAASADMGAELHYVAAKDCDLQKVHDLRGALQYVPQRDGRTAPAHVVVVDEADEMTWAAQTAFLSLLDETANQAGAAGSPVHTGVPNVTIFIFTANNPVKLEERFRSRCQTVAFDTTRIAPAELEQRVKEIWLLERGNLAGAPDFRAIVRECKTNVRSAFMRLERELMLRDELESAGASG